MNLLDHLLQHATPEFAVQLYASDPTEGLGKAIIARATSYFDVERVLAKYPKRDIYFNIALMAKAESGRGDASCAKLLPWAFADIDVDGGKHSGTRPKREDVMAFLTSGKIKRPSIIVDSGGGGFHCYWLLDKPVTDHAQAEVIQKSINDDISEWMAAGKFKYERLIKLSRLLRVPESINQKYGNLVKEVVCEDTRYSLSDFREKPREIAPEFDRLDFDESRNIAIAMTAIQKIPHEWNPDGDGSSYVIRCFRQFIRYGISEMAACHSVAAHLSTLAEFPKKYALKELKDRYQDAAKENELGSAVTPKLPTDEYEFAQFIDEKTQKRMFYVPNWKVWVCWSGQKYDTKTLQPLYDLIHSQSAELGSQNDDKGYQRFMARYRTRSGMNDVVKLLQEITTIDHTQFDSDPYLLAVANGCLRFMQDGTVRKTEHSHSHMNAKISNVTYNPDAKCPRWDQFVRDTFVDEEGRYDADLAEYMQRLSGYCLTGRTDLQHIWILFGSGQNGKGAYTRTMLKLLGDYSVCIDQGTMTGQGDDFGTVRLFGARAAFAQETDQDCRLNEHRVKMLTGGDTIAARRLFQDWWEFAPTHKLFLSTNYVPNIRGSDNGIWRRVRIVPFNASPMQDKDMEDVFSRELSGILNWALEGYRKLQEAEGLNEPECIIRAVNSHRDNMNSIRQFVDEMLEKDESSQLSRRDLFSYYVNYCQTYRIYSYGRNKAMDEFKKLFSEKRDNSERYFVGIRLKSEF